jgi:histidine triad (HIT) family protein
VRLVRDGAMNVTHAPDDYECPACALVTGAHNELVGPEHVVDPTEHTLTFVSPARFGRNHGVLVIPCAHHENLYALPDDLGGPLLAAQRRIAVALKQATGCDGVSTRQHNEPGGNQDLWHFHVHVIPRWQGDGFYTARREWADRSAMDDLAARLRRALSPRTDG